MASDWDYWHYWDEAACILIVIGAVTYYYFYQR
jgi:hypothetical protein